MNFNDMYKDVCITLDKTVGKGEYIACVNTVIRRLNSEAQKPVELLTITGDDASNWEDLTTDDWEDMTTTDWEDELRFKNDVDWDSATYALTLPKDYRKVLSVFYDDKKMQPTAYDLLKDGGGTQYYTTIGNTIYFDTDLENASAEIKIRVKRDYPLYASEADYVGLPENAYYLILNGVCFMLSSRPRYKDDLAIALYKGLFENALADYNLKVLEQDIKSVEETSPFYTY